MQATYRGHLIRARVRRDMGEAFQIANRRRRRPRTLLEAVQRTLHLFASNSVPTAVIPLSLALIPSVTASPSSPL